MTITYSIDYRTTEGNKHVHYGSFVLTSGDNSGYPVEVVNIQTGLRRVEKMRCWDHRDIKITSGFVRPTVVYPTSWPADDRSVYSRNSSELSLTSGNMSIHWSDQSSWTIYWEAKGIY